VVSHATDLVEHAELVVDRLIAFADIVGQENVIAGTDCGLGGSVHPQIAAPSCAPRATARRSRARSWELNLKAPVRSRCASVKKLLAYEKELNERSAKTT
jgi:hypothetical protein